MEPSIAAFVEDRGVVQDLGIRAYANEYWQAPALRSGPPSPLNSHPLELFLRNFQFPPKATVLTRILQCVLSCAPLLQCPSTQQLSPPAPLFPRAAPRNVLSDVSMVNNVV